MTTMRFLLLALALLAGCASCDEGVHDWDYHPSHFHRACEDCGIIDSG